MSIKLISHLHLHLYERSTKSPERTFNKHLHVIWRLSF